MKVWMIEFKDEDGRWKCSYMKFDTTKGIKIRVRRWNDESNFRHRAVEYVRKERRVMRHKEKK